MIAAIKRFFGNDMSDQQQYFAGWEVVLDGSQKCNAFLKTQCVEKDVAIAFETYIQLCFTNDVLEKVNITLFGDEQTEDYLSNDAQINAAIGTLKFMPFAPNSVFSIVPNAIGINQLGGPTPQTLQLPIGKSAVPFQYLGFLNHLDEAFSWLPFDVHLICPIYLNMDKVFLDYTDPNQPVVINEQEVAAYTTSYEELNANSYIEYEVMKFSTEVSDHVGGEAGHTGVPNWIQYPDIPFCPKTGNMMRFLCQINWDVGIATARTNLVGQDSLISEELNTMNFWGDGDLYVFFEPTAKTACYFIQHT